MSEEELAAEFDGRIERAFWKGGKVGFAFEEVAKILAGMEMRLRALESCPRPSPENSANEPKQG